MNLLILQEQQVLLSLSQLNPITISKILELGTMADTYNLSPYNQNFKVGHLFCSSKTHEASVKRAWRDRKS